MDTKLLDILACPVCKGPLKLSADKTELISKGAGLAYPIRDGIPVTVKKPGGKTEEKRAVVIDFQNPGNNCFLAIKGFE